MNKIKIWGAALLLLLASALVVLGTAGSSDAKDITWGKTKASSQSHAPSARDITWGKHANAKDITWGKQKAVPRWPGAEVSHITDDGFDDPWAMYCYNGEVNYLYEGQWSKNKCADVVQISVLAGRQVVCWDRTGDRRVYNPGVTNIGGGSTYLRCVHQLT